MTQDSAGAEQPARPGRRGSAPGRAAASASRSEGGTARPWVPLWTTPVVHSRPGPRSAPRGSMLDVANDAWLSDLLRHGALSDAGVAQELAATFAARDPSVDSDGLATHALLTALEETWERGWQPADVVHVARREATTGSVPLVVALIAEHARRNDAPSRAPDAWIEQLSELGALGAGDPAVVSAWHRAERRAPAE